MDYLIVFLGAGVGGALRHGVNVAVLRLGWTAFPASTLAVNVIGSFLMGVIVEYFALKAHLPQHWRLFLTTGILGGFTTFSAFALEAALLYERGRPALAAAYVLASVILSITALFVALAITRSLVKV
ncbi:MULTISPECIES: fluoride efflux transporter CrcB [Alphaproteobacteria]|uniref:fluoride efflux transporter CrcB n=1 Tax=Alphaproteobacteria TaxID=28211 RepID=UPI00092B6CE0|nr:MULTISPECIES: fluoride efflux transporter CrcB [Alphaproteobacteria]OJX78226.1 MAG: protein CrcB [Magnetospirillum sp. 64-120]PAL25284.1 protein CrcB [Sphingopyxis sp. GW247-27LB]